MTSLETEAIVEAANRKDRAWFKAHPHRNFYLRGLVPGETDIAMPKGDGVALTIVRQIGAGVRMRVPVYLATTPPNTEREARGLFIWARKVRA